MKTINELSKLLCVTPQAVYKKVNKQLKEQLKEHLHKGDKGQTLVDEEGQRIITESFKLVQQLVVEPVLNSSSTSLTTGLNGFKESEYIEKINKLEDLLEEKESKLNELKTDNFKLVQQPVVEPLLNSLSTSSTTELTEFKEECKKLIEHLEKSLEKTEKKLENAEEYIKELNNNYRNDIMKLNSNYDIIVNKLADITGENQVLIRNGQVIQKDIQDKYISAAATSDEEVVEKKKGFFSRLFNK